MANLSILKDGLMKGKGSKEELFYLYTPGGAVWIGGVTEEDEIWERASPVTGQALKRQDNGSGRVWARPAQWPPLKHFASFKSSQRSHL